MQYHQRFGIRSSDGDPEGDSGGDSEIAARAGDSRTALVIQALWQVQNRSNRVSRTEAPDSGVQNRSLEQQKSARQPTAR